jgi:two-component system cell cycle sensor histidine kinase/response regulator CckA
MPEGGKLVIETSEIYLDEQYSKTHHGVTPGAYAMLTVADTGFGMSEETRRKIFDPFFTTKGMGKGTGLGMATVYGIVQQHNGHIYVYSEPGKGTTFKIFFPIIGEQVDVKTWESAKIMPRGTETILIVDDEPSIRKLVWNTLEPLGYHLMEASSGEDALKKYKKAEVRIDLILSDVIMPGMNGRKMIRAFKQDHPELKAILMSGYTDNVIAPDGVLEPGVISLNKPLMPIALANKIRAVLDS